MKFLTIFITTLSIFLTPLFSSLGLLNQPKIVNAKANPAVSITSQTSTATVTQGNNGSDSIPSSGEVTQKLSPTQASVEIDGNDCKLAIQMHDSSGKLVNAWKSVNYVYYNYDSSGFDHLNGPSVVCNVAGTLPPFAPGPLQLSIIPGADPATFVIINGAYAKDSSHVYILENVAEDNTPRSIIVDGADPNTFFPIENTPYAKDDSHVFDDGNLVASADANTFRTVPYLDSMKCKHDAEDKNHYFYVGGVVNCQNSSNP